MGDKIVTEQLLHPRPWVVGERVRHLDYGTGEIVRVGVASIDVLLDNRLGVLMTSGNRLRRGRFVTEWRDEDDNDV